MMMWYKMEHTLNDEEIDALSVTVTNMSQKPLHSAVQDGE